jgi:hypothetical protein
MVVEGLEDAGKPIQSCGPLHDNCCSSCCPWFVRTTGSAAVAFAGIASDGSGPVNDVELVGIPRHVIFLLTLRSPGHRPVTSINTIALGFAIWLPVVGPCTSSTTIACGAPFHVVALHVFEEVWVAATTCRSITGSNVLPWVQR